MYLKTSTLTLGDNPAVIRGEKVDVIVAYVDLREFSNWSLNAPARQVTKVIEVIYDRVIQLAFFYKHTFHKFLGDGFVLIWEVMDHGSFEEALRWALGAAFEIHKRYWYVTKRLGFNAPVGFGVGISCGTVVRIDPETFIPELNDPDFVGYPMNCGARLQKLAGPYGTVLDSKGVQLAQQHPRRVLREGHPMLGFELIEPTEKSLSVANTLRGIDKVDLAGYRYVVWPYMRDKLWKTDGRI